MYIIYMHALGHTTYNLPLALEPITNVSNAHGIYMLIELALIKCLSERISYVLICGDSIYLHILPTNYLSN